MILAEKCELKNTKAIIQLVNFSEIVIAIMSFFLSPFLSDNPNLESDDKTFLSSFKDLETYQKCEYLISIFILKYTTLFL